MSHFLKVCVIYGTRKEILPLFVFIGRFREVFLSVFIIRSLSPMQCQPPHSLITLIYYSYLLSTAIKNMQQVGE